MAKPTIKPITPFDANVGGNISAIYTGALPYSNQVVIYDAETLKTVWTDKINAHTITNCHPIIAGVLKNGSRYCITIQFFDQNGVGSEVSDKAYFTVLATPDFFVTQNGVTPIQEKEEVKSPTCHLEIYYKQDNNESLSSFRFSLYDSEKNILSRSEISYDTDNLYYDFKGVSNRTIYYVRAEGQTRRGIDLDTGLVQVFVNYANPSTYARVYAESDAYSVINGYTNVNLIEPDEDDYEYDGSYIKLLDRNLRYSGLDISGDWMLILKIKQMEYDSDLYWATSKDGAKVVISNFTYEGMTKFKLTVGDVDNLYYLLYSESFEIEPEDIVYVRVKRINNVYQMSVTVNDVDETYRDIYFSMHEPTGTLSEFDVWINTNDNPQVCTAKSTRVVYYQLDEPTEGVNAVKLDNYEKKSPSTFPAHLENKQIWIG